jgi:hypothetical protein
VQEKKKGKYAGKVAVFSSGDAKRHSSRALKKELASDVSSATTCLPSLAKNFGAETAKKRREFFFSPRN